MIVVDSNIIAYHLIRGERTEQTERAFLRDPYWIAPLLWRSELCNILSRYIRQSLLSLEDALDIMQQAEKLLQEREYRVVSASVLKLAAASSHSSYDCEYVALAQEFGVPLVTVDQKVLRKFPETAVSLELFSA